MARLSKEQHGIAVGLINPGIRQAELSINYTFLYIQLKICTCHILNR